MGGACDGLSQGCNSGCNVTQASTTAAPAESGAVSWSCCPIAEMSVLGPRRGAAEESSAQTSAWISPEASVPRLVVTAEDSMQAPPPRIGEHELPIISLNRGLDHRPGKEARIWLPETAISGKPSVPEEVIVHTDEDEEQPETRHRALLRWGLLSCKLRVPSLRVLRTLRSGLRVCVPARIKAMTASASRDISMAARVHSGATVAVVIPHGVALPSEGELARHSLRHPPNVRGWAALTDGSALGLLQVIFQDETPSRTGHSDERESMLPEAGVGWANHGQAKALLRAQIQIVRLLSHRVPVSKQAELRNAPRSDCHEVLSRTLPGARMWPLHDPLVSRVFLLNISRERCRNVSSFCRLDRGPRFLDLARLHYGEEVAFLFSWHSHYIYTLAAFVAVTVPLIIARTVQGKGHIDHSMLPHSLLTILFGVALSEFWRPRAKRLVHRWHAHGDNTSRWHHLVLDLLESHAAKVKLGEHDGGAGQTSAAIEAARPDPEGDELDEHSEPSEPHTPSTPGSPGSPGSRLVSTDVEGHQCRVRPPDVSGDWSAMEEEDASCGYPRLGETVVQIDGNPMTPEEARNLRHLRTRAMCQLEAAAVDACMDTFGIPQKPAARWRRLRREAILQDIIRVLKASLIIPILLLEWVIILVFFSGIVWFEIWVIFDWGGCREYNVKFDERDWQCLSADYLRGPWGGVMGALPSIAEGAFFELLLLVSKVTARVLIRLYHFRTREQHDFAVVTIIFLLEIVGKVGFILVLGLGFVPVWSSADWTRCRHNWDYFIMGEWSLGCLKGQIPFEVRLKLFESIMKGPMWVSGMVGILVKVLVPFILGHWRRTLLGPTTYEDGCACHCRRHRLVRCLLAPADFVLRVSMLILQADCGAVGGLRLICKWPPAVAKEQPEEMPSTSDRQFDGFGSAGEQVPGNGSDAQRTRARAKRSRLCSVLLEGERREHEPFDEYIELLLHFLWTSCFAIVWPLGCVFSLINQILEFRFDCVKLLAVRRRRFPSTRHMSVAWVPRFARIVCHISIVMNVALLLMPYRQLLIWSPDSCSATKDAYVSFLTACRWPQILGAFLGTWLCFTAFHYIAKWTFAWCTRRHFLKCAKPPAAEGQCREKTTHTSAQSPSRRSSSPRGRRTRSRPKLPDASPDSVDSLGMRTQAVPAKFLSY